MNIIKLHLTDPAVKDIGKDAAKALPPGRRHRFYYEGFYKLGDGREIPAKIRALTKPKLEERLADTLRHIEKGMLTYDENIGVLLTFTARLGGGVI
jgi:hypothetical protein